MLTFPGSEQASAVGVLSAVKDQFCKKLCSYWLLKTNCAHWVYLINVEMLFECSAYDLYLNHFHGSCCVTFWVTLYRDQCSQAAVDIQV